MATCQEEYLTECSSFILSLILTLQGLQSLEHCFGVADNSWIQMSIMMSLHSTYSWTWTLVLLGRHPWLSLQSQCTDSSELIISLFTSQGLDELFCITRLYIDTENTLRSQQHWILVELLHTTWIQMRWYEQSTSRWFISLGFYNTDERTQQSSSSLFTLLGFYNTDERIRAVDIKIIYIT